MNLLSVYELTKLWRCHRVTVLRLMRRGVLHWIEVNGEPFFDPDEVQRLNHPRIGQFPHLVAVDRRPPPRLSPPEPDWMEGLLEIRIRLSKEVRQSMLESKRLVLQSRELLDHYRKTSSSFDARGQHLEASLLAWTR